MYLVCLFVILFSSQVLSEAYEDKQVADDFKEDDVTSQVNDEGLEAERRFNFGHHRTNDHSLNRVWPMGPQVQPPRRWAGKSWMKRLFGEGNWFSNIFNNEGNQYQDGIRGYPMNPQLEPLGMDIHRYQDHRWIQPLQDRRYTDESYGPLSSLLNEPLYQSFSGIDRRYPDDSYGLLNPKGYPSIGEFSQSSLNEYLPQSNPYLNEYLYQSPGGMIGPTRNINKGGLTGLPWRVGSKRWRDERLMQPYQLPYMSQESSLQEDGFPSWMNGMDGDTGLWSSRNNPGSWHHKWVQNEPSGGWVQKGARWVQRGEPSRFTPNMWQNSLSSYQGMESSNELLADDTSEE